MSKHECQHVKHGACINCRKPMHVRYMREETMIPHIFRVKPRQMKRKRRKYLMSTDTGYATPVLYAHECDTKLTRALRAMSLSPRGQA